MLKKLKRKFVLATTISLTAIIAIIVTIINIFNYSSVLATADDTLILISENEGHFPTKPMPVHPDLDLNLTPESPYEVRYFTVEVNNGEIVHVNTKSIAAIDDDEAIRMARFSLNVGAKKGYYGKYRYLITGDKIHQRIIYLDCTRRLDSFRSFLLASISGSILGISIIFLILNIISDRVVRPMTESYEKQKRFITNAGHDIKTPLTIINADAELIEMEVGDNEWISDIKKQTARLTSLTSDLIYLARMEEVESLPFVDFPISDVAEEVVSSFAALAKTKKITLESSIQPALFITGDEDSIRKLFTVLIDNAIKYSPNEEIIRTIVKKQGRGVVIKISNKANNLSEESIKHMFDRFYRSDEARSSTGGFGIGLSVAHAVVSAHKGKITAEMIEGELQIIILL